MKPIVKTNDRRWKSASWIVDRFPETYREMTYLEPFLGGGSVFMHKDPSREEVLNEPDSSLMNIWRAVRDECGPFLAKLKRTKYSETTFRRSLASSSSGDYLCSATREFIIRNMSKNGQKNSFVAREDEFFEKNLMDAVGIASKRIESSFLLCREVTEILRAFDDPNTFVYINVPDVGDEGLSQEKHMEIGEILKDYRGKVLVIGPSTAFYKRIYSGWGRKGVPSNSKDSVWFNF